MDLTPFIRELILINESVILRGFGGFDTSYKNASFDQKNKKFVPPGKKIEFRADWIVDNGALEKHISDTLNIPKKEASDHIDRFVKELITQINKTGNVQLEGIGTFEGSEGKIVGFTPFEEENYLADSFGLDTFEVEEVNEKILKLPLEPVKPIVRKKRKKTKWYIVTALLAVLAIITTLLVISNKEGIRLYDLVKVSDKTADTSEIVVFGAKNDILQDSVMKSIESALDQNTLPKKALQPPEPKITTAKPEQIEILKLSTFYLVAGSFKSKKNAETMKQQLEEKGFNVEIISTANQFYNVTIGKFDNMSSASTEKVRISNQLDQSIWVLEK